MSASDLVRSWWETHSEELIEFRRDLHQHPELSWHEQRTTEMIADRLRHAGLDPQPLPGTGLTLDLGPTEGPRILLRADIDALPMHEDTGLEFASVFDGATHSCGHDMHTAMLLGVALALAEHGDELPVGVRFLFQPAEEVMPGGALSVVASGRVSGCAHAFALHCDPKLGVGKVGIRYGAITSAGDTVELKVQSDGGHTSRPHLTQDVVYALSAVATQLPALLSRRVDPRSGTVAVFGAIHAGEAANAVPRSGSLLGTIRTATHESWAMMEPLVRELIGQILEPTGVRFEVAYVRGVPPVINDDAAVDILARTVTAMGDGVMAETPQSGGGEDFAWYLEEMPGAMARLGVWSGDGPLFDLHQPDLVVDEGALPYGLQVFAGIIDNYLEVIDTRGEEPAR